MTSNIGSRRILEYSEAFEGPRYEEMKKAVLEELGRQFRPEFLNRVDETIVFHTLSEQHLKEIVEIQLGHLRARLEDHRIALELTEEAREYLYRRVMIPATGPGL